MQVQAAINRNLPKTILLVEDFDDTRLMTKLWLTKKGYRVVEPFASGNHDAGLPEPE